MTLSKNKILFVCPSCNFAHDVEIGHNVPVSTTCPNCEVKWYVKLDTFSLSAIGKNKED